MERLSNGRLFLGTSQQSTEQQADSRRIQQQTRDRAAATAAISSTALSQRPTAPH